MANITCTTTTGCGGRNIGRNPNRVLRSLGGRNRVCRNNLLPSVHSPNHHLSLSPSSFSSDVKLTATNHHQTVKHSSLPGLTCQTLITVGCSSSHFQSLCFDEKLWSDICSSNWPSTEDPLVSQAISNFPYGHCSFFSDSFPSPSGRLTTMTSLSPTLKIISSIDLRYHDQLVMLQGLTVAERRCSGGGELQKERYGEYLERRRERKVKMESRERLVDMAYVAREKREEHMDEDEGD